MKKYFKQIWEKWKKIAKIIGRFNTRVILSVIFLLILAPLGSVMRLFGWDPLERSRKKHTKSSNWQAVKNPEPDLESLKRQS